MKQFDDTIEIDTIILRYAEGRSTNDEEELLTNWIKASDSNREHFLETKAAHDRASHAHKQTDHAAAYQEFVNKHAIPTRKTMRKTMRNQRLLFTAMATAASVALMLTIYFLNSAPQKATTLLSNTGNNTITQPLTDGTKLTLNKNTNITLTADFGKDNRAINLINGEAFFDVAHDDQHPFTITHRQYLITVIGTAFNVLCDSLKQTLSVTVERGCVSVTNTQTNKSFKLLRGEEIVCQLSSNEMKHSLSENENYISWKTDIIRFEATPLDKVVETINKQYGSHLVLGNDQLRECRINATFDHYDYATVLKMLTMAFDITIEEKGGKQIITGSGC